MDTACLTKEETEDEFISSNYYSHCDHCAVPGGGHMGVVDGKVI
jgi:hypothetical protein